MPVFWKIGAYLVIPQADQHDSRSDNYDQSFGSYNDGIASRLVVAPLHQAEMSEGASSPDTVQVSKYQFYAVISIEHYKLYTRAYS